MIKRLIITDFHRSVKDVKGTIYDILKVYEHCVFSSTGSVNYEHLLNEIRYLIEMIPRR